jgi:glycosyltransferase involved in cell wall biosynthesis
VNEDGVSGLIVPPRDPVALGDALQRLLGDHALRRRLGDGARLRARTMFSRQRMVAAFREVLAAVMREPVAAGAPGVVLANRSGESLPTSS